MKKLSALIIIFLGAIGIFIALLYDRVRVEISMGVALFFLLIFGSIVLIGFDKFVSIFERTPPTHGMTPAQKEEYEREIAKLKAQRDFTKSEEEKERFRQQIDDLAERIRKGGVLGGR